MIPDAGGDVAAAVVAILGIALFTVSAIMSVSSLQSQRTRAKLVSASGLSLATILFIWVVERAAGFIGP